MQFASKFMYLIVTSYKVTNNAQVTLKHNNSKVQTLLDDELLAYHVFFALCPLWRNTLDPSHRNKYYINLVNNTVNSCRCSKWPASLDPVNLLCSSTHCPSPIVWPSFFSEIRSTLRCHQAFWLWSMDLAFTCLSQHKSTQNLAQ